MTKSICALAHKPGNTRGEFQTYYEEHHVPLAISHFPFSGYARNHVAEGGDFQWDTISEFWADNIQEAAALMAGPIGEIMAADEERFMNRSLIASAGVEEVILTAGSRADSDGRRTAILVQEQDAIATGDLRASVMDCAARVARDLSGVSVDFTSNWTERAFPAKAVIWFPGWQEPSLAAVGLATQILRVCHVETLEARLLGG
jgi:uncharacterized protein (TIGR02118 family)